MMFSEVARLVRHTIAPLVVYAVAEGWLPEFAQHDVLEVLVILTTFAAVYGVSWLRDRNKERSDVGETD